MVAISLIVCWFVYKCHKSCNNSFIYLVLFIDLFNLSVFLFLCAISSNLGFLLFSILHSRHSSPSFFISMDPLLRSFYLLCLFAFTSFFLILISFSLFSVVSFPSPFHFCFPSLFRLPLFSV